MATVPSSRIRKIEFYESHLQAWAVNAAAIGLDPAAVLAFQTLVLNARTSYLASETAREASQAATLNFHDKTDTMATIGANLLRTIRTFAENTGNPGVYALAQIPAPASPGPIGPPGQPFNLAVGLLANGALELKWKCDNPAGAQGTVYEIRRRIGAGPFAHIDLAGERSFIDATIPSGATGIVYQITGVRSTTRGAPAQFLVNFGVDGVTATALDNADIRLAA